MHIERKRRQMLLSHTQKQTRDERPLTLYVTKSKNRHNTTSIGVDCSDAQSVCTVHIYELMLRPAWQLQQFV